MNCLILFLIFNLVYANDVLLGEKVFECTESCYSVSKPLLSYIPSMHKRLEVCEGLKAPYPQDRLGTMESQLNQLQLRTNLQIHSVEEKVLSFKNQCEDKLKLYVECDASLQNLNNSLADYQKQIEDTKIEMQSKEEELNQCESKIKNSRVKEKKREQILTNFEKLGSKYYYTESEKKETWFQAIFSCIRLGGHLASPENEEDLEILTNLSRNIRENIWLDLHDKINENIYLSATTGSVSNFQRWIEDEPNHANDDENCVELKQEEGLMNDEVCERKKYYVCEAKFDS